MLCCKITTTNILMRIIDTPYVDGRRFMSADLSGAGSGPSRYFGDRGEIAPPSGRHWMYNQVGIDKVLSENKIYWTRNGVPRLKKFLDESDGNAGTRLCQTSNHPGYPRQYTTSTFMA